MKSTQPCICFPSLSSLIHLVPSTILHLILSFLICVHMFLLLEIARELIGMAVLTLCRLVRDWLFHRGPPIARVVPEDYAAPRGPSLASSLMVLPGPFEIPDDVPIADPNSEETLERIRDVYGEGVEHMHAGNYTKAHLCFRIAYLAALDSTSDSTKLCTMNGLASCLRMQGPCKLQELKPLILTICMLAGKCALSHPLHSIAGYINVGFYQSLQGKHSQALGFFSMAETVVVCVGEGNIPDATMGSLLNGYTQSLIVRCEGLLDTSARSHMVSIRDNELLPKLEQYKNLRIPDKDKASAHRSLARVYELLCDPPDVTKLVEERSKMCAMAHLDFPAECAICFEPVGMEELGLVSLGCFHIFHSKCTREHFAHRKRAGAFPSCPLCRFAGHSW